MSAASARIHAFDWLRGLAVLVMIQTHALVLLDPAVHRTYAYRLIQQIDGLVAPSFIFSAGFALALVQVRAGLAGRRREQAKKSLRRISEVLAVATLINAIWFTPWRQPLLLLRLDILQCIGLSLLLVLPLLVGLAAHPRWLRWVTLLGGLFVFAVAPFGEQATGAWQVLFNTKPGVLDATTGSPFPLLPWAGYVLLGASFGATVASMRRERELWAWAALLGGVGLALWSNAGPLRAAYPPHDFWVTNPADAARRWTLVLGLVATFRLVERSWPATVTSPVARWAAAFGTSSLSAYFFHEMLLFQRHVGVFARFFRGKCDWPAFWALTAALIALTWACVRAWDRLEPRLRARLTSSGAPPRPAS